MTTQMGFPQYDVATLYALSGQTPGTAFPISVSFNRKSQDTVSHLSTTGVLTSAKDTSVKSTPTQHPRAALGFPSSAVCPPLMTTTTPTTNAIQFNPYIFNQYTNAIQFNPYTFNHPYALFASNPELLSAYQVNHLQMASQLAAQANVRSTQKETTKKETDLNFEYIGLLGKWFTSVNSCSANPSVIKAGTERESHMVLKLLAEHFCSPVLTKEGMRYMLGHHPLSDYARYSYYVGVLPEQLTLLMEFCKNLATKIRDVRIDSGKGYSGTFRTYGTYKAEPLLEDFSIKAFFGTAVAVCISWLYSDEHRMRKEDDDVTINNVSATKQGKLPVPVTDWHADSTVAQKTLIVTFSENRSVLRFSKKRMIMTTC